jgi:hypothetical protein
MTEKLLKFIMIYPNGNKTDVLYSMKTGILSFFCK